MTVTIQNQLESNKKSPEPASDKTSNTLSQDLGDRPDSPEIPSAEQGPKLDPYARPSHAGDRLPIH